MHSPKLLAIDCGGNATGSRRELVAVAREADEAREARHARAREAGERRSRSARASAARARSARKFMNTTTSPSAIAAGRPSAPAIAVGLDELVVLAAGVGGGERRRRRSARRYGARPSTMSVVRRLHALPALVAVHRVVAADDRRRSRAPGAGARTRRRCSASDAAALRGGVSRPSRKACTSTRGAPPPLPARPSPRSAARGCARRRARRGRGRAACAPPRRAVATASASAGLRANSPVSMAWSMRVKSW